MSKSHFRLANTHIIVFYTFVSVLNEHKIWKWLLLTGFVVYWAIAFYSSLFDGRISKIIHGSVYGQTLFPRKYRMYTSPPKENILSVYTFYSNGKAVHRLNADSLFHERMKTNFPFPTFKRDLKQYQGVYYQNSIDITNLLFKYYYDSLHIQEEYLPFRLSSNKALHFKFENILHFSDQLRNSIPEINSSDSVVVKVYKIFNPLKMDPNYTKKPAAGIPDMLLYEKGKRFIEP